MSWAVYARYWRVNLLTMLEYRANFLMWFGFTVIYHATAIVALWVTLRNFPSIDGWNFRDTAFLYALWFAGHALHNTLFFNVGSVPEFVREGKFDRYLVRPLDPLFQTITTPAQTSVDELILASIYLGVATAFAAVHVDALFIVYVALVAVGGALIDLGLNLIIATIAFWVIRVDTLRWVMMSLEQEFSRYPISIYQKAVRLVLAFVLPFAFMAYFPATFLLHKDERGLHLSPLVGLLTPLVGCAVASVAYVFWRAGVNRYQGTGS